MKPADYLDRLYPEFADDGHEPAEGAQACGATDVDLISWVKPNENMRDAGSESPDDDTYCNVCFQHGTTVHHEADDPPLFCKCVLGEDAEEGEGEPKAAFRSALDGKKKCKTCKTPYTNVPPRTDKE